VSRPKYAIAEADVVHASEYLRPLLLMRSLELRQNVSYKVAERDFHAAVVSPSKEERAKALNAWCEKYLKAPIWAKLKLAIRKRRERKTSSDNYVHLCFKESV
jgi:macrodomain Ter protein organizer (MatP/YcbG family)